VPNYIAWWTDRDVWTTVPKWLRDTEQLGLEAIVSQTLGWYLKHSITTISSAAFSQSVAVWRWKTVHSILVLGYCCRWYGSIMESHTPVTHDSHYRDGCPWYHAQSVSPVLRWLVLPCRVVMLCCCECTFVETSVHGARVRRRWWLWHIIEEHWRTTVVWSRKVSLYSQLGSTSPLLASELVYFVFIFFL